jgi:hypothetical protein
MCCRTDSLFHKWLKNKRSTCRTLNLDPYLSPHAKVNSNWIKDLNVRPENFKLLQKNIGKLENIGIGNNFLDRIPTPISQEERPRIDWWDYIKFKRFFTAKETIPRIKK